MLVGKKISNKIDYDKLKDLGFIFGGVPSTSTAAAAGPSTSTSEPVIETADEPATSTRYLLIHDVSCDKNVLSILCFFSPKREAATARKDEPKEKKTKIAVDPTPPPPPVLQPPHDEEEEEDEDEEDNVQSAASLLNNFHQDGEGYGGDDDYY